MEGLAHGAVLHPRLYASNCGRGPEEIETIMGQMAEARPAGVHLMAQSNAGLPKLHCDVFAYDEHTPEETARKLWFDPPATCLVAVDGERLAGTYYVRPNHPGRGSHVANGGYIVSPEFRGRGLAGVMCAHSVEAARQLGFRAMQFNFVVSTNAAAVRTWEKHGFAVVGRLPGAFRHAELGDCAALCA